MKYFRLRPEVAGGLGENTVLDPTVNPPRVSRLHYDIDEVWPDDDLLTTFPCFLVTPRLAEALRASHMRDFAFEDVEVSISEQVTEMYPDRETPSLLWLQITGTGGVDDIGTDGKGHLIVSESGLRLLKAAKIDNCEISAWTPSKAS